MSSKTGEVQSACDASGERDHRGVFPNVGHLLSDLGGEIDDGLIVVLPARIDAKDQCVAAGIDVRALHLAEQIQLSGNRVTALDELGAPLEFPSRGNNKL